MKHSQGMMRTLAGAALCAAVYVSGSIQVPTNISLVAAHELSTVKPTRPDHDDDDCVPIAVHRHPSGAVFGEEDCHGKKHYTRMDK
jgi:L-alanine-DL-glutamate epimerase-like enolase superfamily enzyme